MVYYDPSKKTSYEPLPQGTYPCTIEDVRERSSDRGDQWTIWFRVTEGEYEKRIIFDNLYLYGKGLEHVGMFLSARGLNPDDEQELRKKDILDLLCNVGVDIKTYQQNGETKTNNIVVSYDFLPSLESAND